MSLSTPFQESVLEHRRTGTRRQWMALRMAAIVLLAALLALVAFGAVSAYAQYRQVRTQGLDGVLQLKHVQALLAPYLKHPGIPDAATLSKVAADLTAAEQDFIRTRQDLESGAFSVAGNIPWTQSAIGSGIVLTSAAREGCLAGLDLVRVAQLLQPVLQSSVVGTEGTATASANAAASPILTAALLRQVTLAIDDAARHLNATIVSLRSVQGSALLAQLATPPQLTQLRGLIAQWPHAQALLTEADAWLRVAPALLGVNGPEQVLVELMDRGEMRSTGGFIGDYGVITIQNGRSQPFALNGIFTLDNAYILRDGWKSPPAAYPWWPYPGFGLRDSNLSPNFPTTAQLGIDLLAKEGGPQVQGVVALTEPAIARVLAVVGPVEVPEYHQTVTAQNLEAVIRQYTENAAVLHSAAHEQFTGWLGHAFQAKLHGLSASQLTGVAQAVLASLRTKDIQIYMADSQTETLLAGLGFDGTLAHGPGDAVTIVDSNVNSSKANVFTTVGYTDAVTIDAHGTATHHLTIHYDFNTAKNLALRPYIGNDYYKTYLRVYAPPTARLVSFQGFNAGYEEINASDEPGHQMWGGYVAIRDGVPYTLHFAWSVPNAAVKDATGHWRYQVEVQHQAGSDQQLDLTVALPGETSPMTLYDGALDQDRTFRVN